MNYIKLYKFKPIIFQSLGRLSSQILGFLFGVIIVRVSGIEMMGEYAKYTALINISFGVLASGIYSNYLRSNDIRLLWETIYGTTIYMLLFLLFLFPIYVFITKENFTNILLILLSVYFMKLSEIYVISVRFLNIDKYSILPRSIPYLIVIITCLIINPQNIFTLLLILSIAWFTIMYFIYTLKEKIRIKKVSIKKIISSTILLSLTTLATQIYANFDQLMISELLDYKKLGSYKIGVSFSVLAMPLIGVFSFMYISEIKTHIKNSSVIILKNKFYNQLKINFLVSFCFLFFCFLFLNYIIKIVYNIEDVDAANVGVILSIGVVFNVLSMVFSYSLLAMNKDKDILIITLLGAIINIVFNYIFILKFGILGAAFTSTLTQFIVLLVYIYVFYKKTDFFNITTS